jgi:hypothetical protein
MLLKNNILAMPDGAEIDTVTGLKIPVTTHQARKLPSLRFPRPTAAYG